MEETTRGNIAALNRAYNARNLLSFLQEILYTEQRQNDLTLSAFGRAGFAAILSDLCVCFDEMLEELEAVQ